MVIPLVTQCEYPNYDLLYLFACPVMVVYNYRVWLHITKPYIVEKYMILIFEAHPSLRLKQLGVQRMALSSCYLS